MTIDILSDPGRLARGCADILWANDRASQRLGIVIDAVGPGRAQLSMTIDETMVNGHDLAHGGFIFVLADSAFAFACNSRNLHAVAQFCNVTFLRPGRKGDKLTASAEERTLSGRAGIYDVRVTTQDGTTIAEFRGHSRVIGGTFFPVPTDQAKSDLPHPPASGGRNDQPSK